MTPDPDGVNMSHLQVVDVDVHDFTNQGKSLETSGVAKIDKMFHHLKITVLSALVQVQDKHVIQVRHDSVCHLTEVGDMSDKVWLAEQQR